MSQNFFGNRWFGDYNYTLMVDIHIKDKFVSLLYLGFIIQIIKIWSYLSQVISV